MTNDFKIEVLAGSSYKWAGNDMVYGSFDKAKEEAINLASRWLLVTKARVVEFDPMTSDEYLNTTEVF